MTTHSERMRAAILYLSLDQSSRDTIKQLDLDSEREVAKLSHLLNHGLVPEQDVARLLTKLTEAGTRPSQEGLADLLEALNNDEAGRIALAFPVTAH